MAGDHVDISIVEGNEEGYFGTQRVPSGGVMLVQRPIEKPKDFQLSLMMKLIRHGMLSTYLAKVQVFVTEDQPSLPNTVTPYWTSQIIIPEIFYITTTTDKHITDARESLIQSSTH